MLCGGESLATAGVYEAINTTNKDKKPISYLKTVSEPVWHKPTKVVNLGSAFVEGALTRPKLPRNNRERARFFRTKQGKIFNDWKNLSNKQKVVSAIEDYAEAMGCTVLDYEIL